MSLAGGDGSQWPAGVPPCRMVLLALWSCPSPLRPEWWTPRESILGPSSLLPCLHPLRAAEQRSQAIGINPYFSCTLAITENNLASVSSWVVLRLRHLKTTPGVVSLQSAVVLVSCNYFPPDPSSPLLLCSSSRFIRSHHTAGLSSSSLLPLLWRSLQN